jgi:hypothetical protein
MFITKKHLSRRTVLKGAGAAVSLPLLDAMIPAHTALANTAAAVKPRLGFIYIPHGAIERFWVPQGKGKDFQFSRILKPMEGVRDYVTVVTGLRATSRASGRNRRMHHRADLAHLPGSARLDLGTQAGISIDQMAAKQIGRTRRCHRSNCAPSPVAPLHIAARTRAFRWKAIRAKCSIPCSARVIRTRIASRA